MDSYLRKILSVIVDWFVKYGGGKTILFFDDSECKSLTVDQSVKVTIEFEKENE